MLDTMASSLDSWSSVLWSRVLSPFSRKDSIMLYTSTRCTDKSKGVDIQYQSKLITIAYNLLIFFSLLINSSS